MAVHVPSWLEEQDRQVQEIAKLGEIVIRDESDIVRAISRARLMKVESDPVVIDSLERRLRAKLSQAS